VDQEVLRLLWNLKVPDRVDNTRTFPEAAEYIPHRILSFIVRPSYSSLAIFGLKFIRYFVCSSCVVSCFAWLVLVELIVLMMFVEGYNMLSDRSWERR